MAKRRRRLIVERLEDRRVLASDFDYGDAPDPAAGTSAGNYRTTLSDSAAAHEIIDGLYLGRSVDADNGSLQADDAKADDHSFVLADLQADYAQAIDRSSFFAGQSILVDAAGGGRWNYFTSNHPDPYSGSSQLREMVWDTGMGAVEDPQYTDHTDGSNGNYIGFPSPDGLLMRTQIFAANRRPVARWTAGPADAGTIDLNGQVFKANIGNADGVRLLIYLDQSLVYEQPIDSFDGRGVTFELRDLQINEGSTVDIVLDGLSRDHFDATRVAATIVRGDDEDGVAEPLEDFDILPGATPTITVNATNQTDDDAVLAGWIDYNRDGVFDDATERAITTVPAGTIDRSFDLTFPAVPELSAYTSFARFRISTDDAFVNAPSSTGMVVGGEVEDYRVGRNTRIWDGEGGDNDVFNGANWAVQTATGEIINSNRAPRSYENVRINSDVAGQTLLIRTTGNDRFQVRSIDSDATFRIEEKGIFEIYAPSRIAGLELDGERPSVGDSFRSGLGTFARTLIRIDGDLVWNQGQINGLTIEVGGNLLVDTDRQKVLIRSTIRTFGNGSTWSDGDIQGTTGYLYNEGTFRTRSNADLTGAGNRFYNFAGGTWIHDAPSLENDVTDIFGTVRNQGIIDVRSGKLQIGDGIQVTQRGEFRLREGTELFLDGPQTFAEESSIIADAGTTLTFNGTSTFAGDFDEPETLVFTTSTLFEVPVTVANVILKQSASLQSREPFIITEHLDWRRGVLWNRGGNIITQGTTTIGLLGGSGSHTLRGRWINQGQATWQGTSLAFGGGVIQNEGVFLDASDGRLYRGVFSPGTADNRGQWIVADTVGRNGEVQRDITFINRGDFDIGGASYDTYQFENRQGTLRLDGGSLESNYVTLDDGTLAGHGTIVANLNQNGGVLSPGGDDAIGILTIDGNLTASDGRVKIELAGPPIDAMAMDAAGTNYDRLTVTGSASIDEFSGGLISGYVPQVGDAYRIIESPTPSITSSGNADPLGLELQVAGDHVQANVVREIEFEPISLAEQFNQGVHTLRTTIEDWGAFFDLQNVDLPVTSENFATMFGLGGVNGVFRQVTETALVPIDIAVTSIDQIAQRIDAIDGLSVECQFADGVCNATEGLRVRFERTVEDLIAATDFDDSTNQLLTELADAADLDGTIDYDADLVFGLTLGIDTEGFYVLSDDGVTLQLAATGALSADYDLSSAFSTTVTAGSFASANYDVGLRLGESGQRLSIADLVAMADPTPQANGNANISLQQSFEPLDLGWTANWEMTLADSSITTNSDVAFPMRDEFIDASFDYFASQLTTGLGDTLANQFSAVDLPLVDENGAAGLIEDASGEEINTQSIDFSSVFGIDYFNGWFESDVHRDTDVTPQSIADLLSGNLPPGNLLELSFTTSPEDENYQQGSYAVDLSNFPGIEGSFVEGRADVRFRPIVDLQFGLDLSGFFIRAGGMAQGETLGIISAEGTFAGFDAEASGSVLTTPTLSLFPMDSNDDGKLRADELLNNAALPNLHIGPVDAELSLELSTDLLDYVDVDGDDANNTIHGGDVFVFSASTNLVASLADGNQELEFQWSDIQIENGTDDDPFTSAVLEQNLRELSRAVIRGERTELGAELLHAFGLQTLPFTVPGDVSNTLTDGLQIGLALAEAVLDNTEVLCIVPFNDDDDSACGDNVGDPAQNDSLEDWLNNGLPNSTQEIIRLRVELGQLGLQLADELLFDLSTLFPDRPDLNGGVGIANAQLTGELVFGFDTSANPFYLLTAPDTITPQVSTTMGGQFDVTVDVTGDSLGGVVSLTDAQASMSPSFELHFGTPSPGKVRFGDDLTAITPSLNVSGFEQLSVSARAADLNIAPWHLEVSDDDLAVDPPALFGTFDVDDGTAQFAVRRFESGLVNGMTIGGDAANLAFGPGLAAGTDLFDARQMRLGVSLPGIPVVTLTADDFRIDQDGNASITGASAILDPATQITSLAGLLPFRLTEIAVQSIDSNNDGTLDPISLDNLTANITVKGYLDETMLSQLPFDVSVQVGGATELLGSSHPIELTYRMVQGQLRPWDVGPIELSLQGVDIAGYSASGQVTLGGYRQGVWVDSLDGFFEIADEAANGDFRGLRFDLVSQHSSLAIPDNLLSDGTTLSLRGETQLDASFTGSLGGVSLAGARLSFDALVAATPTAGDPPLDFSASFDLREVAADEIRIEAAGLGTLVASDIRWEPDAAAGEAIAEIGAIEFRSGDHSLFKEMETVRVDLVDARLYENRLELANVKITLDGTITVPGTPSNATQQLALLDELVIDLSGLSIPGTFGRQGLPSTLSLAGVTDGVTIRADAAILLPEVSDPAAVPATRFDEDGNLVGSLSDDVPGAAALAGLSGTLDPGSGAIHLSVDHIAAAILPGVSVGGLGAALNLDPNATAQSDLLTIPTGELRLEVSSQQQVSLQVNDLRVKQGGEVSILDASLAASGGVLTTIGFGGMVPLDLTSLKMAAVDADQDGTPDARTVLNRDLDRDGLPDGDFQIEAEGFFDFTPLSDAGADVQLTIGQTSYSESAPNRFDVTFRMVDGILSPWDAGPITFGLTAQSDVGFDFNAELVSQGYTDGEWNPGIQGTITGQLALEGTTVGTGDGEIELEIKPGSRLDFDNESAQLVIDGEIRFLGDLQRSFAGVDVTGGSLDFQIVIDAIRRDASPPVIIERFDVRVGQLQIDKLTIDVDQLGSLTLSQILVDPAADANEPIATIGGIEFDFTDHPILSQLTVGLADIDDARVYHDRIELGRIEVSLNGLITDGDPVAPSPLLWVDDLLVFADDLKVDGAFDVDGLFGRVAVSANIDSIQFDADAAILIPDDDVNISDLNRLLDRGRLSGGLAGAIGVSGSFDGQTGALRLHAKELMADVAGLRLDANDVALTFNDPGAPLAEVDRAVLGIRLIDERSVDLGVDQLRIDPNGQVSIGRALLQADDGAATTLGFAGILPLDVTRLEIQPLGGPTGTPIILNRDADGDGLPDGDLQFDIEGSFDFAPLRRFGVDAEATIGGIDYVDRNQFQSTFRLVDGVVSPWETGPIAVAISAGPYSGLVFDADLTLGGYQQGVWDPAVSGSMSGTLYDDDGNPLSSDPAIGDLSFVIDPTSRLFLRDSGARLRIDGAVQFDGALSGAYGGISLAGANLDLSIFADTRFSSLLPLVQLTRFDVLIGELSIDEIVVEVANLGTLTFSEIVLDRNAATDEPIGRIESIVLDVTSNPSLGQLTVAETDLRDALLYRDRIELVNVQFLLDGIITDGSAVDATSLLSVDDLELNFTGVEIQGTFHDLDDLATPAGSPILVSGQLDGVALEADAAILLPDAGEGEELAGSACDSDGRGVGGIALVCGLRGTYSPQNGSLKLSAARVASEVIDGLVMEAFGVELAINDPDPAVPIASADEARLSLALIEPTRPIDVQAFDVEVDAGGEISLSYAEVIAQSGVLDSIGLAGLLPMDVTQLRLGQLEGPRTVLNRDANGDGFPDEDFSVIVDGAFDFSLFQSDGIEASAVIGPGQTVYGAGSPNTFQTEFRFSSGRLVPWNLGPIEIGLSGQPVDGVNIDGRVRLGGYVNGVWQSDVGGTLTGSLDSSLTGGLANATFTMTVDQGLFELDDALLDVTGTATFDANAAGSYGGISLAGATMDFSLLVDAASTAQPPFVILQAFEFTLGDTISVDSFSVNLADVLILTANQIDIFAQPRSDGQLGTVGQLTLELSEFGLSSTVTATGAQLYQDRLQIPTLDFGFDGMLAAGGVELLQVSDLSVGFSNVQVAGFDLASLADGDVVALRDFQLAGDARITVSAGMASVLPNASIVSATVTGLDGTIIFDEQNAEGLPVGTLDLVIDSATASMADGAFSLSAGPSRLRLGPTVTTLLEVSSATLGTNLFGDTTIALTANGLRLDRDGVVSIDSASIGVRTQDGDQPVGIGEALGLADGLLPLDVSFVGIEDPSQRIALNVSDPVGSLTSIDQLDIEVQGFFDFSLFDALPFDPYIQVGDPESPDQMQRSEDSQTTFDLSFRMNGLASGFPKIEINDTGPIALGILDYDLGPLSLDRSTITLGGFENGSWQSDFDFDVQLTWEDSAGLPVDFRVSASGNGDLYGPDQGGNPNAGATTLVLDASLMTSLAAGNLGFGTGGQQDDPTVELAIDPASDQPWGFGFEELEIDFEIQFSVDFSSGTFAIEPVSDGVPLFVLDGVSAEQVAMNLSERLWMSAEEVQIDFDAFSGNTSSGEPLPFLAFGGDENPGGLTLQFGDFEGGNDPDQTSGSGGAVSNPLSGLGGSAGNFGIAWDGDQLDAGGIPFEFVQFEDMFFEITLPENGGFGLGALIPVSIEKIGVRFPETFGDIFGQAGLPLLSPSEGESPPTDAGELIEIGRQGLEALKNFTLVFSGSAEFGLGMAAIGGQVDDIEVHVGLLYEYASEILDQLSLQDPLVDFANELVPNPDYFEQLSLDPSNPNLPPLDISVEELVASSGNVLSAIEALGPRLLILFPDLVNDFVDESIDGFDGFPVRFDTIVLDAEVGLGPLTLAGSLGVSAIDVPIPDVDDENSTVATKVWLVTVEGSIDFGEIAVGGTLQFTQFGPIGVSLNVDVPLPVGMIAGALAGSVVPGLGTGVGAAIGKKSGFIMEDFEGILYFEESLPAITTASDILSSDFKDPLNNSEEAQARIASLFSVDEGRLEYRQPWREGFRLIASGFLTNKYVKGLIGANITLGANVNFGGFLTGQEQPGDTGAGAQLYVLADLEIADNGFSSFFAGQLAQAGLLFDFSDPLNPVVFGAADGNTGDSLLALLFPIDATMEMEWRFDGVLPGMIAAVHRMVEVGIDAFDEQLDVVAATLEANRDRLLARALLDADGDNVVEPGEATETITREFIKTRLTEVFALAGDDTFTSASWGDEGVLSTSAAVTGEVASSINRAALVAQELVYELTVATANDPADFLTRLLDELLNAGQEAYDLFFEIIQPSFMFAGAVQPVLLGMPIGEPRERVEVHVDKHGIAFDGKFRVLEKLMAISPLPIPLYDEINVGVEVPFENLFKDLAVNRIPQIDLGRDWRATFTGEVRLFDLIDLGRVSGIMFPSAPELGPGESLPQEIDNDQDGIPDDHPLETHVVVLPELPDRTDPSGASVGTQLFGFDETGTPLELDKIVVLDDVFPTLRENGGILLDAQLILPQFITDPVGWFTHLQTLAIDVVTRVNEDGDKELIPACRLVLDQQIEGEDLPSALECFLSDPIGFLDFFTELPDAILAKEIVAQAQLYVPNFTDELVDGLNLDDPQGLFDLLREALVGVPDLAEPSNSIPPDPSKLAAFNIQPTIARIRDLSYFFGEVGNVPGGPETADTLFGIELGGGRIEYVDPNTQDDIDERRFRVVPNFDGLRGQFEFASVAATDPSQPGQLPPFDMVALPPFPAFGGSLSVSDAVAGLSEVESLLTQFGLAEIADWLPGGTLTSLDSVANATFEFYTPGFNTDQSAPVIERHGGIGADFELGINDFIEAAFEFSISPSESGAAIPDFEATGAISELPIFSVAQPDNLRLMLDHRGGSLTATLDGGFRVFGFDFDIPDAATATFPTGAATASAAGIAGEGESGPPLQIFSDGFAGQIGLSVDGFGVDGLFEVDGSSTFHFDSRVPSARIEVAGSGTISGLPATEIRGSFGTDGCFEMEAPFPFEFALPGGNCNVIPDKQTLVVSMVPTQEVVEQTSSASDWNTVQFEVVSSILDADSENPFEAEIPWAIETESATANDVRYLPNQDAKDRLLKFDNATLSHTIELQIRADSDFERPETFQIRLGAFESIDGQVDGQVATAASQVRILNDDDPDLGLEAAFPRTLVFFDFDLPFAEGGFRQTPKFSNESSDALSTMYADEFESSFVLDHDGQEPQSVDGLPTVVDEMGVITTTALSNGVALYDAEELDPKSLYLEFEIEPTTDAWMIQGLEFYSYRPDNAPQDWELRWSLDDFQEPIFAGDSNALSNQPLGDFREWSVHQERLRPEAFSLGQVAIQGYRYLSSPVTFRLINATDDFKTPWIIDNLSIGGFFGDGSLFDKDDLIPDPEINDRFPWKEILVKSPGDLKLNLPDPGTIDPGFEVILGGGDITRSEIVLRGEGRLENDGTSTTSIDATGGLLELGFHDLNEFDGPISLGDVERVGLTGTDLNGQFTAEQIKSFESQINTENGEGGDVAATMELDSLDSLAVVGGDLTSTITTKDALHDGMDVSVASLGGRGGRIDSPNSFHIAGGVGAIVANQINLRVEAGGIIESIRAVDDGPDRPAVLQGHLTAHRFGRIEVDENGTADFVLTATATADELMGLPAFEELLIPEGSSYTINLQPGVIAGPITIIRDSDGDGVSDPTEDAFHGGDGNQDGIPDRDQPNVVSFPTADGRPLTLETSSDHRLYVPIRWDDFSQQSPTGIDFADPFFTFYVSDAAGGTIDDPIELSFLTDGIHDLTSLYLAEASEIGFVNTTRSFSRDSSNGTGLVKLDRNEVVARFLDGGRGDFDGRLDGRMTIVGGFGLATAIPAQNPIIPFDVNNDSRVSPLDALRVINVLASGVVPPASSERFLDVSGDENVSPLDALRVINELARQAIFGNQAAEAESVGSELIDSINPVQSRGMEPERSADWDFGSKSTATDSSEVLHGRRVGATKEPFPYQRLVESRRTGEQVHQKDYCRAVDHLLSAELPEIDW